MLVSPKDENRSEAVRAEKARLFLEQFIEIEAEWISNWLSMENGETFGADMALLTLEKYRWDDGYHFDTAGIKTAITLFRDMLGGELAAGIVLASYVKNDRPIPEEFKAIHIALLQPTLRATKSQTVRPKERRDYLMAWLVYLIHNQFELPKTMRAGRKKDIGNTAGEIVQAALIKHFGDFGFAAISPRSFSQAVRRFANRYPAVPHV